MFDDWRCGRFTLDLSRPKIMGILNCTPDSFSDGGKFIDPTSALAHAEEMIAEGANMIDVGAESTRPGAQAISVAEEIARLTPVVKALVADGRRPVSVDTKNTATMRAMLELGIDMINDVHGLEAEGAVEAVADSGCGICLMHMRGMPETMQKNTQYENVVSEVDRYLRERASICEMADIATKRIILDPGFGFGKSPVQNMALIRQGGDFCDQKYPVLIGVSRKSTIGHYLDDRAVDARLTGSVTLAALGAWLGARIVRVHDVQQTRDALEMVDALQRANATAQE